MAAPQPRDESSTAARYRRSLAALLSEIERPQASESTLLARSERCASAFEELQRDPDLSQSERQQLLSLVSSALAATLQQKDDLSRRLLLTREVLRTTRGVRLDGSVGDWCDIAG